MRRLSLRHHAEYAEKYMKKICPFFCALCAVFLLRPLRFFLTQKYAE